MTGAGIRTDASSNEGMTPSKEIQKCAVVFRLDSVVHWQSHAEHCKCSARAGGHGGAFTEEQCKVGCDAAGDIAVSVRHERCGEQSVDDGTGRSKSWRDAIPGETNPNEFRGF